MSVSFLTSRLEDTNPEVGQQLESGLVTIDKQNSSSPENSHCDSQLNAFPPQQEEAIKVDVQTKETLADWGVVVCVFFSNFIASLDFTALGVLYPYLVEDFEATTAAVGWCSSVNGFFQALVALFASYPIQSLGCRIPAVVGSLLVSLGLSLSCLAPNLIMIYFAYGVISGIGYGLALLPAAIIIHQRLTRNRNLASGIGQLGFGVGGRPIVGSVFANHLVQSYGWRGTFLILGAIQAQRIPLSMFFKTPKRLISQSKQASGTNQRSRLSQMILRYLKESFNFSIFRHVRYSVYSIACFLYMFCLSGYWPHTVNRAINVGLSLGQGVAAATLISTMSTTTRLFVSFISNLPKVNSLLVFATGMLFGLLSIISIYINPGIIGTMTSAALYGLYLGSTTTMFSIVAVDLMGVVLLPKSLAMLQFTGGFARLVAAPIVGWIYDETHDYNKAFAIIGCMAFVSASLMIVLAFVIRSQRKSIAKNVETPLADNDTVKPPTSEG